MQYYFALVALSYKMPPLCRLHSPKMKCTPLNRQCTPMQGNSIKTVKQIHKR